MPSGPFNLVGLFLRNWINTVDEQQQAFVQIVFNQRGEKLRMLPEKLCQTRLYTDIEAAEHEEAATGALAHG